MGRPTTIQQVRKPMVFCWTEDLMAAIEDGDVQAVALAKNGPRSQLHAHRFSSMLGSQADVNFIPPGLSSPL